MNREQPDESTSPAIGGNTNERTRGSQGVACPGNEEAPTTRCAREGRSCRRPLKAAAGRAVHDTDDHESGEDKTPNSTRAAIHLSRHVATVKQKSDNVQML